MKIDKKISSAGIVVLSLFDGMSCGQIALQRAKIPVKTYYACEQVKDKDDFVAKCDPLKAKIKEIQLLGLPKKEYKQHVKPFTKRLDGLRSSFAAVKVTQYNFPKTIQLGDVRNIKAKDLPEIPDLFIGGSPCQGFSNAGTGLNFEHPESKLFFEYIRLRNELLELNPNLKFFLENVPMKKEWENIITRYMGINHVKINSASVSAQNRKRLYWNNFNIQKHGLFDHEHNVIEQPKDKKIFLKDILDNEVNEKYFLSGKALTYLQRDKMNSRFTQDSTDNKGQCVTANYQKGIPYNVIKVHNTQPRSGDPKILQLPRGNNKGGKRAKNGKTPSISANNWEHNNLLDTGNTKAVEINNAKSIKNGSQGYRVYPINNKSITIAGASGGLGWCTGLYKTNSRIRRLTPDECARLQTVDPQYFKDENGKYIVSESRIYEMLGNGWTIDVIVHQLEYLKQNFNL